jgi:uncharacterized membrane protein YczE
MIRTVLFCLGIIICSASVALFLKTYLPAEAYEISLKEITEKFNLNLGKFKTIYDCICLAVAIALSLLFFKELKGIGIGTIISALANGFCINKFSNAYDSLFEYKDKFKLKKYIS